MTAYRFVAALGLLGVSGCAGVQKTPPATTATVRFTSQMHHTDCDIVAAARPLADAQAVDCGEARGPEERLKTKACVEAAEAAGKPFIAVFHLPGIDSAIAQALLRATHGERIQLWYDSSPSGGPGRDRSFISRKACERFVQDPEDEETLRCESPPEAAATYVCRGTEYALGAPQSASGLRCSPIQRYIPGVFNCAWKKAAEDYEPVPPGTALACMKQETEPFRCSSTPEADAVMGLRFEREPPPGTSPEAGP
ncbi:hypothetical protein D7X30_16395 [Corallococcus sp. AB011P]|uniref:hypothetical protein n=1 Tax=Corallococcus sp. AB011P TaxID=2316735 RepID=UPI000EA21746|nr:hypothetical protein [Corallococcus sp. AB011P]RKG58063.1 hypothetical protein D7X30_16395 [Corallococcus sp. AB011P]